LDIRSLFLKLYFFIYFLTNETDPREIFENGKACHPIAWKS